MDKDPPKVAAFPLQVQELCSEPGGESWADPMWSWPCYGTVWVLKSTDFPLRHKCKIYLKPIKEKALLRELS